MYSFPRFRRRSSVSPALSPVLSPIVSSFLLGAFLAPAAYAQSNSVKEGDFCYITSSINAGVAVGRSQKLVSTVLDERSIVTVLDVNSDTGKVKIQNRQDELVVEQKALARACRRLTEAQATTLQEQIDREIPAPSKILRSVDVLPGLHSNNVTSSDAEDAMRAVYRAVRSVRPGAAPLTTLLLQKTTNTAGITQSEDIVVENADALAPMASQAVQSGVGQGAAALLAVHVGRRNEDLLVSIAQIDAKTGKITKGVRAAVVLDQQNLWADDLLAQLLPTLPPATPEEKTLVRLLAEREKKLPPIEVVGGSVGVTADGNHNATNNTGGVGPDDNKTGKLGSSDGSVWNPRQIKPWHTNAFGLTLLGVGGAAAAAGIGVGMWSELEVQTALALPQSSNDRPVFSESALTKSIVADSLYVAGAVFGIAAWGVFAAGVDYDTMFSKAE